MTTLTEADVEQAALDWLIGLGWQVAHGSDIAPETPHAERDDYEQVVLERRLRDALAELNSGPPLTPPTGLRSPNPPRHVLYCSLPIQLVD